MKEKTLTVFTPTYNRAYTLGRLYESLVRQTSQDFQWIVVDDGSTDDTEELVAGWIEQGLLPIYYYKQENGGKPRAHNRGVEECDTELFMCMDSDDYLTDNCVEVILRRWQKERDKKEISGIIALKGKDLKEPLGTWFPKGVYYSTYKELYNHYKFKGDSELIFRTEILKKYPYWVAEGEKFIGEGYVWQKIDCQYTLAVLHEIVAICEYLEDGYSQNVRKLTKDNPISYTELRRQSILYSTTWKNRFYHTILCIVGCILQGKKNPFPILPYKLLGVVAYLPAWLAWFLFFRKA